MQNNNCEINHNDIQKLEERVTKLENQREKDKAQVYELDKSLNIFIKEMKHISDDLKNVVTNFKEAIMNSTNAQEKEIQSLKEKIKQTDDKVDKLGAKLEQETIGEDAKKWKNISWYILTIAVGAVVGYIFSKLGIK